MGTRAETLSAGLSHPEDAATVAPSDADDLPGGVALGLYVGLGGDVEVVTKKGTTIVFKNVPTGGEVVCQVKRVKAGNTTAQDIVAYY